MSSFGVQYDYTSIMYYGKKVSGGRIHQGAGGGNTIVFPVFSVHCKFIMNYGKKDKVEVYISSFNVLCKFDMKRGERVYPPRE